MPVGWTPGITVNRSLDLGIASSSGLNALIGPPWVRFNDWPPGDGKFSANDNAPFTNVFQEASTAVGNGPALYNNVSFIQVGSTPHRFSASLRGGIDPTSPNGTFGVRSIAGMVYGGRAFTDGLGYTIYAGIYPAHNAPGLFQTRVITPDGTDVSHDFVIPAVVEDTYYRVGIEVLANVVRFYLDPAGAGDPSLLSQSAGLVFMDAIPFSSVSLSVYPAYGFLGLGGWLVPFGSRPTMIGDAFLDELQSPPGTPTSPTSTPPPGTPGTPTPPVIFPPGTTTLPYVPFTPIGVVAAQYSTYKSMRQAVSVFNNLDLRG